MLETDYPYSRADLGKRLDTGYRWQWFAAYQLGRQGFDVRVSKHRLRAEGEDHESFRHEIDVAISLDGQRWEPVEVKSKNERFTIPEDWPFPDVIAYGTRKGSVGMPVLFVSVPTKAIVGLLGWGHAAKVKLVTDRARGIEYPAYCAPCAELKTLGKWGEEMKRRLA
jgi:hypothetical protein